MCQVQRVTNSCGHINDHVLMSCYLAKDVTPSPPPSHLSYTVTNFQESYNSASATFAIYTSQSERQLQSEGKGHGKDESSSIRSGKSRTSGTLSQGLDSNKNKKEEQEDMIQRFGFEARNQPYCKLTVPKVLDSPKGFKCMVYACGRAD
ncbi:hypothetical protein BDW60DRAFT_207536 [Aspergillus nidulans var. acristatus]